MYSFYGNKLRLWLLLTSTNGIQSGMLLRYVFPEWRSCLRWYRSRNYIFGFPNRHYHDVHMLQTLIFIAKYVEKYLNAVHNYVALVENAGARKLSAHHFPEENFPPAKVRNSTLHLPWLSSSHSDSFVYAKVTCANTSSPYAHVDFHRKQ